MLLLWYNYEKHIFRDLDLRITIYRVRKHVVNAEKRMTIYTKMLLRKSSTTSSPWSPTVFIQNRGYVKVSLCGLKNGVVLFDLHPGKNPGVICLCNLPHEAVSYIPGKIYYTY